MGYTQPLFNVRKVAGGYSIYPDGVTTDDLVISANPVDAKPTITLYGNADVRISSASGAIYVLDGATQQYVFWNDGTAFQILCPIDAHDIYLRTTGTGVVKFGSYTAGAATDSTGYITIKDAAGNTRKLMVQA